MKDRAFLTELRKREIKILKTLNAVFREAVGNKEEKQIWG